MLMSKYVVTEEIHVIIDDDDYILQHFTDKIKVAITQNVSEKSKALLKSTKKYLTTKKPKNRLCKRYDPDIDGPYEAFCMYYHILEIFTMDSDKHPSLCSFLNYNFDRWVDLGMPSIARYNQWKEPVKYTALILTTIANCFKLWRAKYDGGASFIGTLLQGVAHAMFVVYFTVLSNEHALAIPKLVGVGLTFATCIWILDSGKGFL